MVLILKRLLANDHEHHTTRHDEKEAQLVEWVISEVDQDGNQGHSTEEQVCRVSG